jgi:acetyl-CoA carboxylase biotin carboxyl carrier protein
MHAKRLVLVSRAHGDGWHLCSPMPGKYRPSIRAGAALDADDVIGILEVLGTSHELVVPPSAAGYVTNELDTRIVQFGDVIVELAPGAITGVAQRASAASAMSKTHGLVFRAPTSGRFYGRASPDKPAFVSAGDELATGATVCLLEVMKTFHRVHFGGADMPSECACAKIAREGRRRLNAGDVLLGLDPILAAEGQADVAKHCRRRARILRAHTVSIRRSLRPRRRRTGISAQRLTRAGSVISGPLTRLNPGAGAFPQPTIHSPR